MSKTGWAALAFLGVSVHCNVVAAEGLKPIEYTLSDGAVIRFYGQLNVGVLHYDDGRDDFTNFVDNDNSDSRVGVQVTSTSESGDWIRCHLRGRIRPAVIRVRQPTGRLAGLGHLLDRHSQGGGCLLQRALRKALAGARQHGQRRRLKSTIPERP